MPDDSGLHPGAILAPEMDAFDGTALERLASHECFGVPDEGSLKVVQEVQVLLENVIRVEVREVRETSAGISPFDLGFLSVC